MNYLEHLATRFAYTRPMVWIDNNRYRLMNPLFSVFFLSLGGLAITGSGGIGPETQNVVREFTSKNQQYQLIKSDRLLSTNKHFVVKKGEENQRITGIFYLDNRDTLNVHEFYYEINGERQ